MTPADGTAAAPNGRDIRIRMYDVGFGDCFLVGFPSADHRERLVLIDCGVHFASQGGHPIPDVIADIKREATSGRPDGQPRIDIVVATHRHQDHVSGFEDQDVWADVEVGEVWLPWTEDPDDEDARIDSRPPVEAAGAPVRLRRRGARS